MTGAMQIESYRKRLEEFERDLNRELYRFYSGQKNRLEIRGVYSDYSDFFSVDSIREAGIEYDNTGESFSSRRKSLQKICEFLIDQYLDSTVAALFEENARFEAGRTVMWEGKEISFSAIPALIRDESDAIKRRKLEERIAQSLAGTDLRQRIAEQLRSSAANLGFKNYTEARERTSGIQYAQLLESYKAIFGRQEDRYLEQLRVSFESALGLSFRDAGCWDVAQWRKKNNEPRIFSKANLLPVVDATARELGVQPERPESVQYDLEPRAQKHSRSFCIPIRIPHEIKIVLLPEDGSRHYAQLLHESGHAYHFAWTSASLPAEHRIWGDRALTEAYAFLFEDFILDAQWLSRMISFTRSKEFLHNEILARMLLMRRHAGKLAFAVRYHGQESLENMPEIYAETMQAYTGLQHNPESWLRELPDGFASANYLRGWILESMLKDYLRSKYGTAWFCNRSAAGFLKEIWETGQLYRADELCREIGIGDLDPEVLADELSEGLR